MEGIISWIGDGQKVFKSFLWTCPVCEKGATVTQANRQHESLGLRGASAEGMHVTISVFVVCPNPVCQRFALYALLYPAVEERGSARIKYVPATPEPLGSWQLVPAPGAKSYPDYVPKAIRQDYTEASLVRDLSPKASATLARRCLQGMIRNFYEVKKTNLKEAIDAIEDKVAPLTWQSIDAVRKIGNIGAHMEKDIDLIIDVEPEEAAALVWLIEYLIEDWYVNRHEREKRLEAIVALNDAKEKARKTKRQTG